MKNSVSALFILFGFSFCFAQEGRHHHVKQNDCAILDSMHLIRGLPDDYLFYPHGDSICSRIISLGAEVLPCLIERIADTTASGVRVADTYNYLVGDIAMLLIERITYNDRDFPDISLRELMLGEFGDQISFIDEQPDFNILHYRIFIENTAEKNYLNRQRMYNAVKEKIGKR